MDTLPQRIDRLFPTAAQIPESYRLPPLEQDEYLINGELRHWPGPYGEARSAVWLETPQGAKPVLIGHYPLLDETEALAALAAARDAYGQGRGPWPTMAVAERIGHVQAFLGRFREVREAVVRLLMWEVGKSAEDAGKEFDRTATYMAATIEALKDLDRSSSRLVIEEGIIAQTRRGPLGELGLLFTVPG